MAEQYYCLIDQKSVPSMISYHANPLYVVNDYLVQIENRLDTLIQYNASVNATNISFDNLFISLFSREHGLYECELNRFSFDFGRSVIFSRCTGDELIAPPLIINRIRRKVDQLCKRTSTGTQVANKSIVNNKDNKPQETKKSIVEETKNLVCNIANKQSCCFAPRNIPDLSPDTESEKEDEEEDEHTHEHKHDNKHVENEGQYDDIDSIDSNDMKELEKQINELKKIKENEESKLDEMVEVVNKDSKNFSKYFDKLNDDKRAMRVEKDRAEEKKRIYEADKRAYRLISEDIAKGKLKEDQVSPLIMDKLPIYKFMDEKDMLDKDGEYELFLQLYDEVHPPESEEEDKEEWVPHNYHYLTEEEKKKYDHVKDKNKDVISEFVNRNLPEKNYPSLEQVLRDLGDDSDDNKEATRPTNCESNKHEVSVSSEEESDESEGTGEEDSESEQDNEGLPVVDSFDVKKTELLDKMVGVLNKKQ